MWDRYLNLEYWAFEIRSVNSWNGGWADVMKIPPMEKSRNSSLIEGSWTIILVEVDSINDLGPFNKFIISIQKEIPFFPRH